MNHFRQALEIEPDNADTHINLGNALLMRQRLDEAISHFRQGLEIKPEIAAARYNLAKALGSQGHPDQAIRQLQMILEIEPNSTAAHYDLARLQARQGRLAQAVRHFRQVVEKAPDNAQARFHLARALSVTGQPVPALKHLHEALRIKKDWPAALNETAWILATHHDPKIVDGEQAVRLAERATELTSYQSLAILDTLAAAYAAAEQFDWAVETSEEALALTSDNEHGELVLQIRQRLELYKQKKRFKQPAPVGVGFYPTP